jgi:hypothetical protein
MAGAQPTAACWDFVSAVGICGSGTRRNLSDRRSRLPRRNPAYHEILGAAVADISRSWFFGLPPRGILAQYRSGGHNLEGTLKAPDRL